jgi:hypothetical protein
MTTILWHIADTHINNKVGLRVPTMVLDEQDSSGISPGQRFLWRCLMYQCDTIKKLAKKHRAKVWVVFGGDLPDLDTKFRTQQIYTRNTDVVKEMVNNTIEPVLDIADREFIVLGTESHVGRMEQMIAADITNPKPEIHPDTGYRYAHKWWIDCEGVQLLIQHHGKLGRLPWTKANALNQKSKRLKLQYRNPPNIFIQAHNHQHETSSMRADPFVIAAPCMKLHGEYEERIDADEGDYGGMYFVCKDNEVIDFEPMLRVPKGIKVWRQS